MPLEKFQSTSWCLVNYSTQVIQKGNARDTKKIYNSQYCGLIIVLPSFTTYYVSSCDKSCEFFCVLNIFLFRSMLVNYLLISSLMALFSPSIFVFAIFFFFYSPLVFSNFLFYYSFILQSTVVKKKINVFVMKE